MDVARETQSVRVDEVVTQPQDETAMDRAELESMIEREGLPLGDEPLIEPEGAPSCDTYCAERDQTQACINFCACLRSDPTPGIFNCWLDYVSQKMPKRP